MDAQTQNTELKPEMLSQGTRSYMTILFAKYGGAEKAFYEAGSLEFLCKKLIAFEAELGFKVDANVDRDIYLLRQANRKTDTAPRTAAAIVRNLWNTGSRSVLVPVQ